MKKLTFISMLFFIFTACNISKNEIDEEAYKDDADVELTEAENENDFEYDNENDSLSDSDESVEFCGPDLTKEEWETEEWKKGDDDKDGIPNGYECKECPCVDQDGNNSPDYQDEDSESDGIPDNVECPEFTEENGCRDTDGDERPDYIDRDSDNDGLSDNHEKELGTDPYKNDTDGDGDDDLTEIVCNETNPLDAEDYSTIPTICTSGCYSRKSVEIELTFNVGPREQTDITFLIDATGSMEESFENIKLEISDLINEKLSQVNEADDISFGLIEMPYDVALRQTKDAEMLKTRISEHSFDGSWEIHLETIYQSMIGDGFKGNLVYSGNPFGEDFYFLPKNCKGALGNIGGACLRENANHILILLSDEEILEILSEEEDSSNGLDEVWKKGSSDVHKLDDVVEAARVTKSKFVQISTSSSPNDVERSLLEETASQNAAGEVLFFDSLDPENGKLSDDIVAAINSLLEYEQKDLQMELILPDSSETYEKYKLDCSMDVSFKTLRAEPEEGIEKMDETTFFGVKKGTEVTYEVNFDEVSCYDGAWTEDDSVKTYYLYPQLKSDNKVIATEIIQVKIFPVKCE
ncbi:VWA domain-containing protein [bacterium]|nr:VWA domain-containing protein [bacterium]